VGLFGCVESPHEPRIVLKSIWRSERQSTHTSPAAARPSASSASAVTRALSLVQAWSRPRTLSWATSAVSLRASASIGTPMRSNLFALRATPRPAKRHCERLSGAGALPGAHHPVERSQDHRAVEDARGGRMRAWAISCHASRWARMSSRAAFRSASLSSASANWCRSSASAV
jgi:hypothetical protein